MEVKANLWPWGGRGQTGGPMDLTIGTTSQTNLFKFWYKKVKMLVSIEQIEPEQTNVTLIRVLISSLGDKGFNRVLPPGYEDIKWYRCSQHRRKEGSLRVRIKGRVINQLAAPIPQGKYVGSSKEGLNWAVLTFQAMTLKTARKEEPRSVIIQPGDPEFVAPTGHPE